jgi:CRP-like cAMP-binding protein
LASGLIDERTKFLLISVPYFQAMDDGALAIVAREVITRSYRAGEIIFLEGERDAGLHLVAEGCVKFTGCRKAGGSTSWLS